MNSSLKIEQTLSQKQTLRMTLQMRQSIEMLLKNNLELREMILKEAEENPFLEIEDWGEEYQGETQKSEKIEEFDSPLKEKTAPLQINDNPASMSDILADFDWQQIRETSSNNFGETNLKKSNDFPDDYSFNIPDSSETLAQSLDFQITLSELEEKIKSIMIYMAYNLDDKGFLPENDEEIAAALSSTSEETQRAREALKKLDPAGCGCRNLVEYLRFIFIDHNKINIPEKFKEPIKKLFTDETMLNFLVKKNFDALCEELVFTKENLKELLSFFRNGFAPYPAFSLEDLRTEYVRADVKVFARQGEPIIYIDDKMLPTIILKTEAFEDDLKNAKGKEDKKFIKEKYKNAEWIIKSISERNRTLYQVTAAIFSHQKAFLEYGVNFLKPLTLKDVADDIDRHITTVSRLTTGKYVQTPHGIFELKYFFVKQINDNLTTNKRVEQKITEIIKRESRENPYSDDDVAHILGKEGVEIARRTVAKYRAKLGIPLARERRRNYQFSTRD